jgi:hypothetical protein
LRWELKNRFKVFQSMAISFQSDLQLTLIG